MSRRYYPYDDLYDPFFGPPTVRRPPRRVPRRPAPMPVELVAEPEPAVRPPVAPEPEPEPEPERAVEGAPEPEADKESLRNALRELEKAKARVERDAARVAEETRIGLIDKLFPVLDNLDRSIAAGQGSPDESLLAGVELVREQFAKVLADYGVERIDAAGEPFDPNEHDAIGVVAVDDHRKDGVVVDQWEPGYRLGNRVLRPAKVRVGKLAV